MSNPSGANQVLKKIYEVTPNAIRVTPVGALNAPPAADTIVATYPSSTVEVYSYKSGGVSGTLLATITVTYTNASKQFVSTVVRT